MSSANCQQTKRKKKKLPYKRQRDFLTNISSPIELHQNWKSILANNFDHTDIPDVALIKAQQLSNRTNQKHQTTKPKGLYTPPIYYN